MKTGGWILVLFGLGALGARAYGNESLAAAIEKFINDYGAMLSTLAITLGTLVLQQTQPSDRLPSQAPKEDSVE